MNSSLFCWMTWFFSILIASIASFCVLFFLRSEYSLLMLVLFPVIGIFMSFPLIITMRLSLRLALLLPYSQTAIRVWYTFLLWIQASLFFHLVVGLDAVYETEVLTIYLSTLSAIALQVYLLRSSLYSLRQKHHPNESATTYPAT